MWRRCLFLTLLVLLGCKGESLIPTEPAAAPAPDGTTETPTVIATAVFEGANGYRTTGSAVLEESAEGQTLRLGDDFETDRSVALDVRLCNRRRCGGEALVLGSIQSFTGAQSYAVPGDGSGFAFVVIWCTAVELPFGVGALGS